MSAEHEMRYRAGTYGLGHYGIFNRDPHWYCTCGRWRKDRTGPSTERAKQSFAQHVKDATTEGEAS